MRAGLACDHGLDPITGMLQRAAVHCIRTYRGRQKLFRCRERCCEVDNSQTRPPSFLPERRSMSTFSKFGSGRSRYSRGLSTSSLYNTNHVSLSSVDAAPFILTSLSLACSCTSIVPPFSVHRSVHNTSLHCSHNAPAHHDCVKEPSGHPIGTWASCNQPCTPCSTRRLQPFAPSRPAGLFARSSLS